jgi:hypothetical protein
LKEQLDDKQARIAVYDERLAALVTCLTVPMDMY